MDKTNLPDLTQTLLERAFPRTFLCLNEAERKKLAQDFAKSGDSGALQRFPECLARKKWHGGRGFVADLARLEYSLRLVGLAPAVERSGFEGVTTASEPEWYAARFRFDPAHRILESDWPLDRAYAQPQETYAPAPGVFLLYRTNGKALFRPLDDNEEMLIRSLSLGVPLGRVLERNRGPDFDAMTFHRWIESGLLRAIDWAPVQNFDTPLSAT